MSDKKTEQAKVTRAAVETALKEAGYTHAYFKELVIQEKGVDVKVVDIFIDPSHATDAKTGRRSAIVDPQTKNYAALAVAKKLGLQFRELQEFNGETVILRWVRNLE